MDKNLPLHQKELVSGAIDGCAEEIISIAREIEKKPEIGYKEFNTTRIIREYMSRLELADIVETVPTGVIGKLKQSTTGGNPNIAVMGELDAIYCQESPIADPLTGAAHVCGHNLQSAIMLAVAAGFKKSGIENHIAGNIFFMGVPAEEYVDISYRRKLIEQKTISFIGGKQEFISRGCFDDIDMAIISHAEANKPGHAIFTADECNGFICKSVRYIGKIAHAGVCPENGINALNAALIGLNAVNALRDTFRSEDYVRVHPIITKGGDSVNVVPADVQVELYVRARTMKAIEQLSDRIDAALISGGIAVGAETVINNMPGYLPLKSSQELNSILLDNSERLMPGIEKGHVSYLASGDTGDLSHLIPVMQVTCGGVCGIPHSREFRTVNYDAAVMLPAKAIAHTIIDLLADNAAMAGKVTSSFTPLLTKQQYLEKMNKMFETRINKGLS